MCNRRSCEKHEAETCWISVDVFRMAVKAGISTVNVIKAIIFSYVNEARSTYCPYTLMLSQSLVNDISPSA